MSDKQTANPCAPCRYACAAFPNCGCEVEALHAPQTADLVDACLRVFHGNGPHGWSLLKQQWPEAAVAEQHRKMGEVVVLAQSAIDLAAEVRRLSGCLLVIAGAVDCGGGSMRTAAFEAASMGATVSDVASKLESPVPRGPVSR